QHLGTCLYVRPYSISVHVQPSDGETEKQLPVQPQIVFLDKKGRRIDTLGPPSEPWVVSAHLKGSSEAVLKGLEVFSYGRNYSKAIMGSDADEFMVKSSQKRTGFES
ncbi:fibrocystin-like, partial [Lagopus leucura]|uniref:fibrocystin-like n=1 Tax=Lagopus leucura TaxID=30410 RepID=UPI001C680676